MTVNEVCELLNARIVCGKESSTKKIEKGYSSDLMSDVLTLDTDHLLLITGLCNLQTIRTAEMADIRYIVFVRNKKISFDMLTLAEENNICIMESPFTLFKASGILFNAGLKPVY
jgi:serine kinase of HPr protein (carbohydrate metabolism regulator)